MKSLIAAALLLALASPVSARDENAPDIWFCPGGVTVTVRNFKIVGVSPRSPLKAATKANFDGPGPDFLVQLGGKPCKIQG